MYYWRYQILILAGGCIGVLKLGSNWHKVSVEIFLPQDFESVLDLNGSRKRQEKRVMWFSISRQDHSSNLCSVLVFRCRKIYLIFMSSLKNENIPWNSGTWQVHSTLLVPTWKSERKTRLICCRVNHCWRKPACRNAHFRQCLHCSAGTPETLGVIGERIVGCK